jgi:hypothetical protein
LRAKQINSQRAREIHPRHCERSEAIHAAA